MAFKKQFEHLKIFEFPSFWVNSGECTRFKIVAFNDFASSS